MRNILLLCGKTASGKTVIQGELAKLGFERIITYTTRRKRRDEINGIHYHFISDATFHYLAKQGFFAGTVSYDMVYGKVWYGAPLQELSGHKVLITNPYELKEIKKIQTINTISCYLNTSEEVIRKRLNKRGDNLLEAERRIVADKVDFSEIDSYVDFTFSNDGELKPSLLAEMIKYTYERHGGE